MAHTPGPWVIKQDLSTQPRVWRGKALIAETGCQLPLSETEANARLIAAAPDLLSSCYALLEIVEGEYANDSCPGELGSWKRVIKSARAAIAKSEGGE